jgi:hypothetical protein
MVTAWCRGRSGAAAPPPFRVRDWNRDGQLSGEEVRMGAYRLTTAWKRATTA